MDDRLATWTAAGAPGPEALTGRRVELQPLQAARHAADLFAAAHGRDADPHLWDHMAYGPFPDAAALAAWAREREDGEDPRFYAVVDRVTGRAGGVVSLMRVDCANGCIEIGNVWFGAALQRTPQATEAIALLARHAFDDLGHRRLEWKCDAANARSRAAALRLGFTYEGTFRQHMIVKGRNRDTAWFAIVDGDWPAVKAALEAWLDPANFDARGRQRASLAALRT
ncbi:GNAT family N-acetyltransferase [Baekduia soli]|uniref:GNAT family N-acetyltransferase n=1 Tax=Baekduia soli TaxID=496014 RepID=A0A5B8UBJ8_9ACTN|nr:GNAT family protein [Baekduia soli]QEC50001.1 GNAT family N-acetyltransferase [Baekduia soli]